MVRPAHIARVVRSGVSVTGSVAALVVLILVSSDDFDNADVVDFAIFVIVYNDIAGTDFVYVSHFTSGRPGFAEDAFGDHAHPAATGVFEAEVCAADGVHELFDVMA